MDAFAPRRPEEAARWLSVLVLLAGALLVVVTPLTAELSPLVLSVSAVCATFCVVLVVFVHRGWRPGAVPWLLCMLASAGLILASNLVTRDASAAGQLYFLLPAVASAAQLRPRGAWLVAGACSAADLVLVLSLLEPPTSLVDWGSLTLFTAIFVALLSRAADRQEALERDLRRQAAIDPVTGLLTRRVLDEALSSALRSGSDPVAPSPGTVLVIADLDHFKGVNDTHGHPVGDAALSHVGRLLVEAAGAGAVVSRLGGDELAVLLPGTDPVSGLRCGERVVAAVRATPLELPDGASLPLTVSVGVAHSPVDAPDVESLYRAADAALYEAKRGGRDRVAVARRPAPRGDVASRSGAPVVVAGS